MEGVGDVQGSRVRLSRTPKAIYSPVRKKGTSASGRIYLHLNRYCSSIQPAPRPTQTHGVVDVEVVLADPALLRVSDSLRWEVVRIRPPRLNGAEADIADDGLSLGMQIIDHLLACV